MKSFIKTLVIPGKKSSLTNLGFSQGIFDALKFVGIQLQNKPLMLLFNVLVKYEMYEEAKELNFRVTEGDAE
jgi:hypothetical protein